jgi:phosphatidylethanolamine/phosphatidyl-N-methylethanolamine N-methyltransferase
VTRALLQEAGVPEDRLILVERDGEMAGYLTGAYPGCSVLDTDVFDLMEALPPEVIGKVGTVICGVPLALFDPEEQRRLVDIMFALMPENRPFVMLTYRPAPPIPGERLGLVGRRLETTFWNLPPASVWGYARSPAAFEGVGNHARNGLGSGNGSA